MAAASPNPRVVRTELAEAPSGAGAAVAALVHVSDLHVLDAASPMRFEWIETLAHDPRWHPLLHMYRPQEALVPWAVAAHLEAIRLAPVAPSSGRLVDLVLSTGDNIDNGQRNELDAYLALFAGGTVRLDARGSALEPDPAGDAPWPFWCPEPGVADGWKPLGFPAVPGLLDRLGEPLTVPPLGLPWTSLPGNHDLMCQGTSFVPAALEAAAVGDRKALSPPPGFAPDDPLTLFVDAPERFLGAHPRRITAVADRRPIGLREWVDAHATAGASGLTTGGSTDVVVDAGEVAVVLLDTNHPAGDYQGSIGGAQLAWLDEQLARADRAGQLVVLASHHGSGSLINERPGADDRHLAAPLLDVLHRHPSVVAWLGGHQHRNRIRPHPGASGGFWEITTCSVIDWPVERRVVELVRHPGGGVEIVTTMQTHDAPAGSIAALHRDLARRFDPARVQTSREGTAADRETRLHLRR